MHGIEFMLQGSQIRTTNDSNDR